MLPPRCGAQFFSGITQRSEEGTAQPSSASWPPADPARSAQSCALGGAGGGGGGRGVGGGAPPAGHGTAGPMTPGTPNEPSHRQLRVAWTITGQIRTFGRLHDSLVRNVLNLRPHTRIDVFASVVYVGEASERGLSKLRGLAQLRGLEVEDQRACAEPNAKAANVSVRRWEWPGAVASETTTAIECQRLRALHYRHVTAAFAMSKAYADRARQGVYDVGVRARTDEWYALLLALIMTPTPNPQPHRNPNPNQVSAPFRRGVRAQRSPPPSRGACGTWTVLCDRGCRRPGI